MGRRVQHSGWAGISAFLLGGFLLSCGGDSALPPPIPFPPSEEDTVVDTTDVFAADVGVVDVGPSPVEDTSKPAADGIGTADVWVDDSDVSLVDVTDPPDISVVDVEAEPDGEIDTNEPTEDVAVGWDVGGEGGGDPDVVEEDTSCTVHTDCPGLQLCSIFQLCEEPPICLSDDDCLLDRVCSHGVCTDEPFGCQTDLQCSGGYCNPSSGKCLNSFPCVDQSGCAEGLCSEGKFCVECLDATDCPTPGTQTCAEKKCVEPEVCASDADCLGGRVCTLGSCADPALPQDLYEPNNSSLQATLYGAPLTEGLTLGSGDEEDWYRINVNPLTGLLFRVDFDDTHGDLDLHLYEVFSGTLINQDTREQPFALVGVGHSLFPGVYDLVVTHEGGVIPSYSLTYFESPKPMCVNDSIDQENTIDTLAHAPLLEGQEVFLEGLMCCPGDADWFKTVNGADFQLTVQATYPDTISGNLKLTLVADGGQTEDVVLGVAGEAVLFKELLDAGTWYVGVSGNSAAVQTSYTLSVKVEVMGGCEPDFYEPNDSYEGAPGISSGGPYGLSLCPEDEDWFAVNVPVDFTLTGYLSYPESGSVLEIRLLEEDGETVLDIGEAPAEGGGQGGMVVHGQSAFEDETFLLQVHRLSTVDPSLASPYELLIDVKPVPCVEEEGEDNGSAYMATQIPIGIAAMTGSFCPPDYADWYAVTLFPGQHQILDLQYNGEKGKLLLNLYDPMAVNLLGIGVPVATSGSVLDLDVPSWWEPGVYKVLVTGAYEGPYTLNLQTELPGLCPVEDVTVEPNNTLLTGISADLDEVVTLALCPGDPDAAYWLGVPDQAYAITVEADNPGDWLYVKLYSSLGKLVLETQVTESPTTLEFPATELFVEGAFFLKAQSDLPQIITVSATPL